MFENDITFDYTLYTGADPESFGGFECKLNAKTFRPGNGRKQAFYKCFRVMGVFRNFFREGALIFVTFQP